MKGGRQCNRYGSTHSDRSPRQPEFSSAGCFRQLLDGEDKDGDATKDNLLPRANAAKIVTDARSEDAYPEDNPCATLRFANR